MSAQPITQQNLCERYYADVYRFACHLLGESEQAQDLTQETFYKALRAWASFQADNNPFAWLCTIAHNIVRDQQRKQGQRLNLSLEQILFDQPHREPAAPETADPGQGHQYDDLYQAIDALPRLY